MSHQLVQVVTCVGSWSEGEGNPSSSSMFSSPQVVFVDGNGLFHHRGNRSCWAFLASTQKFHRRTRSLCLAKPMKGVTFGLSGRVRPGLPSWSAVRPAVCGRGQEPAAGTGRVQECRAPGPGDHPPAPTTLSAGIHDVHVCTHARTPSFS